MFDVHVVRSPANHAYAATLDEMFHQRHKVFVRILGWDLPDADHEKQHEADRFDGPETVYLLVMRGGDLLGASRMVPTTGPHLMRDVFPGLCSGGAPAGPDIWEWSRGHVKPDEPHQVRSRVLDHIFLSGYEFALAAGIGSLTAQINAAEFPRWLKRGLVVEMLGPPLRLDVGGEIAALRHKVTPATLARVREQTGIFRAVLTGPDRPPPIVTPKPRMPAISKPTGTDC